MHAFVNMHAEKKMRCSHAAHAVCPQIVRQQTLLNTEQRQHAYLSKYMTTAHSQRDMQIKWIYFYIAMFFVLIITDTRPCSDLTALFLIHSSIIDPLLLSSIKHNKKHIHKISSYVFYW